VSGGERAFDRAERFVHWAYALLFLGLVATGALLIWLPAARAVALGGERVVPLVHVGLGLLLLGAPFLPALRGWGGSLRRDLRDWLRWRSADLAWLLLAPASLVVPGVRAPGQPRFNAGQRLNGLWSVLAWGVMGVTGLAIWSGRGVPIRWREAAYEWHLFVAVLSVVVVLGHVGMAVVHPGSMRAMLGWRPRAPDA
jgi:formate dehydrogenase subunit gamma